MGNEYPRGLKEKAPLKHESVCGYITEVFTVILLFTLRPQSGVTLYMNNVNSTCSETSTVILIHQLLFKINIYLYRFCHLRCILFCRCISISKMEEWGQCILPVSYDSHEYFPCIRWYLCANVLSKCFTI